MEQIQNGVIILYNKPASSDSKFKESESDVLHQVEAVASALKELGIPCRKVGITKLPEIFSISNAPEEVVFNLVESLEGQDNPENAVPPVIHSFGKFCTGNPRVSLNKWATKAILSASNIPVPAGFLVPVGEKHIPQMKGEKMIVKPAMKDGSEGIDSFSVIKSDSALKSAVEKIHKELGQDALVEAFIDGRELNVSIFQEKDKVRVMPLAEIDFSKFDESKPRIVGYSAKWLEETFEFNNTPRIIPAPLPEEVAEEIRKQVVAVWKAMECSGYARVDMRLDKDLKPYILEVNMNPCISPDSGFAAAIEKAGVSYKDFVMKMIETAIYESENHKRVLMRHTLEKDKEPILEFVRNTEFFRDHEVVIADEVLRDAVRDGPQGHYKSYTAEANGEPVGWVCFGQVPCTMGTFDIYWIAVSPHTQKRGVGSLILKHAEKEIAHRGGRVIVIETSGNPKYSATRKFYEKNGYIEKARIHDFYFSGDDKVMYVKYLPTNNQF
jgi:D-alanine-D-alanine ligase